MSSYSEIHVLKSRAGMDEGAYRAFLSGWGVESSKELSPAQYREAVARLRELAGQPAVRSRSRWTKEPYCRLDGRAAEWATCSQLYMLFDGLWLNVTRQTTRAKAITAFEEWLHKRFEIARIEWITKEEVGKIKLALEAMARQEAGKKR